MDADNFTLLKFIQSKGKPKNKCLISWNYKVGLGGGTSKEARWASVGWRAKWACVDERKLVAPVSVCLAPPVH